MSIEFAVTDALVNTQFGPVAALAAYYERHKALEPLQIVIPAVEKSDFPLANQLTQVWLSILTGCEYVSVVNTRLRPERKLAQVYRIQRFAHQATLSRSLDGLSLANLAQLAQAVQAISQQCSRARCGHDWRGFPATGLRFRAACRVVNMSKGVAKAISSGKKTSLDGS